ncbi:MAG TPA: protein kinase [Trichormus sp.]
MTKPTRVLLVEDQKIFRLGLRISLEKLQGYQIVGEAEDGETAVKEAQRLHPDVILMDVGLPRIDGVEATWKIKQSLPRTRVVMFSSRTSKSDVTSSLGAGADGYCSKDASSEQIADAITAVLRGEVWLDPCLVASVVDEQRKDEPHGGFDLSPTEQQILGLIKEGSTNQQIASRMGTSVENVAREMHKIINRFVLKAVEPLDVKGEPPAPDKGFSTEWYLAMAESPDANSIFAEKYLIEGPLGAGGIGAVFKAKHLLMERPVALKVLLPEFAEDPQAVRNFQREAKAIANLQHRNIVHIYDFGISKEREPYLVMEYIDGKDLADVLAQEPHMPVRRVISLCLQICAGLAEAHAHNVLHCDLKPSNVLISGAPPDELVKVVDFGLAQITPRAPSGQHTVTDKFFVEGTPLYMAPEQTAGRKLDARTDVYSLGCMMYEALAGVNPFRGVNAMETFRLHLELVPEPISTVCPEKNFPGLLSSLINRMLAKEPAQRPGSMDTLIKVLNLALEQAE